MNNFSRRQFLGLGAGVAAAAIPGVLGAAEAKAPLAPLVQNPGGFFRFKIEGYDAWSISDGDLSLPGVQPTFAANIDKAVVDAALTDFCLPLDRLHFPMNVLVLRTSAGIVLFDAGTGGLLGNSAGFLKANLLAAGIRATEVVAVFISHAHEDHVGGLVDPLTGAANFPNARIYVNKVEFDFWTANPVPTGMLPPKPGDWRKHLEETGVKVAAIFSRLDVQTVSPGDRIIEGVDIIAAPGHTPGHLNFRIGGPGGIYHIGDCIHSRLQTANPEWSMNFDGDEALARATRKQLLENLAANRTRAFAPHLGFPGVGHIRRGGVTYDWIAE